LILDQDNPAKWDKLADLRLVLGETVLAFLKNDENKNNTTADAVKTREKVSTLLKEWDSSNVFGGPTFINQLKRELTAPSSQHQQLPPASSSTTGKKDPPSSTDVTVAGAKVSPPEASTNKAKPKEAPTSTVSHKETTGDNSALSKKKDSKVNALPFAPAIQTESNTTVYDFEAQGIPAATVEMKELQNPCKSLATLQIARDLRHESTVQVSSLLAELPAVIREQYMPTFDSISDDKARDLSIQTNEAAIDVNVEDELANVRLFRDIIEKQKDSRQMLILLLVKCRCKFGSDTAAQAFEEASRAMGDLKKRQQVLQDAMDLEGIDVTEVMAGEDQQDDTHQDEDANVDEAYNNEEELTLPWYKAEEKPPKKARLDD
jgi:hypothetical protein